MPVLIVDPNDAQAGKWWGDEIGDVTNGHNWKRDAARLAAFFGTLIEAPTHRHEGDEGPWIAIVVEPGELEAALAEMVE